MSLVCINKEGAEIASPRFAGLATTAAMKMDTRERAAKFGLYDPRFEHDGCGVGFVCDIKGRRSNQIIRQALEALSRLSHRGATGADPDTGDGAGILLQVPHEFFVKAAAGAKIDLPEPGAYGTGLIFLPSDGKEREFCKSALKRVVREEGCSLLGWRRVPVDDSGIGETAKQTQPVIEQVFIGVGAGPCARPIVAPCARPANDLSPQAVERRLYVIRKRIENAIRASRLKQKPFFYITNLSSRTFSYKGLLTPSQLGGFFVDLNDKDVKSSLCLVHSRYSTNTFPTWDLAQPFRFLAHNGEINTLRGNINWMRARQGLLKSPAFGKDLRRLLPVIAPGGSDSAGLDNAFELLALSGRGLAHAMMMLIPPAWQQDELMARGLRDFYKYHACLTEAWDGPAAIAFTDGRTIGAVLDRNGLRPARYAITKNGLAVMASEAGVLDIKPQDLEVSGRLKPGRMFFIDTLEGRIIDDAELKEKASKRRPYGRWLKENLVEFSSLRSPKSVGQGFSLARDAQRARGESTATLATLATLATPATLKGCPTLNLLKAFGYTREDLKFIIRPMAETGYEPIGSMGNDTPHAVLSARPADVYSYFKQLFAQVTNPAIDPIREELVMSLDTYLGPEKNILDETPRHCRRLRVKGPILTNAGLTGIKRIKQNGFKAKTISLLFDAADEAGLARGIDRLCKEAKGAIKGGFTFIILSDRGISRKYAAIPSLLACGALHRYLVENAMRTRLSIILETADAREVHHFALLFGFGADCINPYLAYEAIGYINEDGLSVENYISAVEKGILKILSKMGISTLQSYRGAQQFEALGLSDEVIDRCFKGVVSRIGGAGFDVLTKETVLRHKQAFSDESLQARYLAGGGLYQWKKDGEFHLWNPESIAALQDAARQGDYKRYEEFADLINNQSKNPVTLRGLLKFKQAAPIPLEEVEAASELVKRFATGAMSFGSISRSAHETIAWAMNRLGGRSNTGEGGEDPARFKASPDGRSTRSAIKQVASGRFGVTTNYLVNADELQIKIAQGAKPGEGGQLPGHKVSAVIARTRYTTPGVTLISPPPHHDIYSIEDLAQLIFDLKNTNPAARVSVKLVSEIGVGTVAAGVAKGHADMILISGGDGGTGASPLSSIRHAGLPWELGLSETHQTLVLNGLRDRVRLQADGQMRTGRDVALAALLGADEFGFCTSALVVLGCVMLRHCHLNNCSVGVATQDDALEKRFNGRPEYLINYFNFVAEELRRIMAGLGIRRIDEMIGRTDFLGVNKAILPWKAKNIDLSRILYRPVVANVGATRRVAPTALATTADVLDRRLIELAKPSLESKNPVKIGLPIGNKDRAAGAMLSGEVCKRFGEEGLPQDTIRCKFKGVAGQSFGAWLAQGVTFELEGMANDYVGKGISGGRIIIYPDRGSSYRAQENIIIGNTAFYGAITGEAYISGIAGERFCIRNSGLYAVVEGAGDHCCEYMTGGRVVVLGETGRNFAAGMSGGIAYVYAQGRDFKARCNLEMVALEKLSEEDAGTVKALLVEHRRHTQSRLAGEILGDFKKRIAKFVKVMPLEYKRILGEDKTERKSGLTEVLDG